MSTRSFRCMTWLHRHTRMRMFMVKDLPVMLITEWTCRSSDTPKIHQKFWASHPPCLYSSFTWCLDQVLPILSTSVNCSRAHHEPSAGSSSATASWCSGASATSLKLGRITRSCLNYTLGFTITSRRTPFWRLWSSTCKLDSLASMRFTPSDRTDHSISPEAFLLLKSIQKNT